MNKVSTRLRCEFCGGETAELLQKGVRHRPDLEVHRCGGCSLVHLSPLPTEAELATFYTEAYRAEHEPGMSPETAHRTELPEARLRVERLRPLLTTETSILEVGASSGAFLASVRPFAAKAKGVEPAKLHREWAVKNAGVSAVEKLDDLGSEKFDVIVLFHVLEHVRHPAKFLTDLLSRLKPRGRVCVEVPNVDDALLALYQVPAFGPHYYQDAHLWYFSPTTLAGAAKAAGASIEVTGIQRYDLSNHLRWLLTGKPGGLGFYRKLFPESLDRGYAEALIRAGHSDTLWGVLRAG